MMSLRPSATPADDTRLGLPAPAPLSTKFLVLALIHFCHASIIFASSGLRSCSGFFIQSSMTVCGAIYSARNLLMVFSFEVRLVPSLEHLIFAYPAVRWYRTASDSAVRMRLQSGRADGRSESPQW